MRSRRPALLEGFGDLGGGAGRQLLEATVAMGFSEPVARAGLQAELDAWHAPGAVSRVLEELPGTLNPGRLPQTALVVAARTLPVSAMRSVLMARLLGARVLLKPASGQEAFAQAVAAADPEVTAALFASTDREALADAVAAADAVVVLGSDQTVASVRALTRPDQAFVGYGHKVSAAWLDAPTDDDLRGLALDLCAWDQAGCLSPQVAWVTGDLDAVGADLAAALREVEADLPLNMPAAAGTARLSAVTLAEMTGGAWRTTTAAVLRGPSPAFKPSPGWRTLWLLPADPAALASLAPTLSTLAVTGPPPPVPPHVRLCRPGEMQRPPLDWPHDGQPNLLPMLRPAPGPR